MKPTPFLTTVLLCLAAACGPSPAAAPPPSPYAQIDALIGKRELAEAAVALEALRAERGPLPELSRRLAEIYRLRGDGARAVLRLRESIEANPSELRLHVPLAQLYLELNQNEAARDLMRDARAKGADDSATAMTLGSALGRLGELDGALAEFARAEELGADKQLVCFNQALIQAEKRDYAGAKATLARALELRPGWPEARRELARVMLSSSPGERATAEQAIDILWEIKDALPNDWRLFEAMGDAWLTLGDFPASLQAYTEALRLGHNPKSVEERYVLAKKKQRELAAKPLPE